MMRNERLDKQPYQIMVFGFDEHVNFIGTWSTVVLFLGISVLETECPIETLVPSI
jgi:hypothetical protein